MITLQELCDDLDRFYNVSEFEDFCPNGLQIEGKKEINRAATAVSASLETLQKAVDAEVDALIVHHGIFWNRDPYPIVGAKREKIDLLLKNGISLIAYHLPMDAHEEAGNNWKAAKDLGWENLEPFSIGVKGSFSPIDVSEFQSLLEKYYDHKAHTALGGREKVSSAALISGGAHKEIEAASREGVDCFITGSFDEPVWHAAKEEGINFFALGHSNTEIIGPKALGKYLSEKFSIDTKFLHVPNPF